MTGPVARAPAWWDREVRGRAGRAAALLSLAGAVAGCAVGHGQGDVLGVLDVDQCTFDSSGNPRPINPDSPALDPYNLHASFFVADPIDSNSPRFPQNQIFIRVQDSTNRLETANALIFDISDSYEVARCMRGRINPDMTDDWDPTLCDRTVLGPSGEGRVLVGMESETVRSFFVLNDSCPEAMISADALGRCDGGTCPDTMLCPGRGSWISFSRFGAPPADPTVPVGHGFKVNDGEQITASAFHVELCDRATVDAVQMRQLPIPKPVVRGIFEGWFDFSLVRGQAGQPFP